MTMKSKKSKFPLPKLSSARRISGPIDHEAAESVEAIARIIGAGAACIPTSSTGGRPIVIFRRSKKLKGLVGHATCIGKTVTLSLHDLTRGEAVSVLQTLVFTWPRRKSRRQGVRR